MKKVLLGVLAVVLLVTAAFAQDPKKPDPITIEGKIVVEKSKEGKDIARVKAGLVDLVLADGPKLQELLKVDKMADKTFILEGEKISSADGKSEAFSILSFKEEASDHDHGGDHKGHDHEKKDGAALEKGHSADDGHKH